MSAVPVVLKSRGPHTATMIFLHGLGDTGHGWAGILNTIKPDYLKVVCPTAPSIPVTLNNGFVMPAWYDIRNIEEDRSSIREDLQGVENSVKVLQSLIDIEARELKDHGKSRIMIGGFSQGGAIALSALLKSSDKLAGCIALSTYIPGDQVPERDTKIETPVIHCHGEDDQMISIERGRKTSHALTDLVQKYEFHTYPHMGHEASQEEMDKVQEFVSLHLPPLSQV